MAAGLWLPSLAAAGSLLVMWDRGPEPEVVGYRVFVGTASGEYTVAYDVGNETAFVLAEAVEGRRYFFSIAAFTPGPRLGPRSAEVSGVAEALSTPPPAFLSDDARASSAGGGRLLFVEDAARVRLIEGRTLLPEPALETGGTRLRLTQLRVDPSFERTGFVFVGEVERRPDAGLEFVIRRYRMAGHVLGEGARIVSGLPVAAAGDPVFTIDPAGAIHVAIPAGDQARDHRGYVLSFNPDGTTPRTNRSGTPIVGQGFVRPTALEWDEATQTLWLSGVDPQLPSALAYLPSADPESDPGLRLPRFLPAEQSDGLTGPELRLYLAVRTLPARN